MKSILLSKDFTFVNYTYQKYRYTDNREGSSCHYLAVMQEGWCRIAAPDCEITVKAGEAFYIPMGLSYQSYWYSEGSIRFLSYGFNYFPGDAGYRLQKLGGSAYEKISGIPLGYEPNAAALGKFFSVLGELMPGMALAEISSGEKLMRMAAEYMRRNVHISIPEVARRCCVSESTLYAAFRAAGTTPNDVRQKLLVEKAVKQLMTTGDSVQQISDKLGFSSTDYFRRVLKKHTDMSPREIRSGAKRV